MTLRLPRPGPSRAVAVTTVVALAMGATGWLIGAQVQSPADAAAAHRAPTASLITVAVERRALTATVTAQGTLSYGAPRQLALSGVVAGEDGQPAQTQLITKAPTAGSTLREGGVLLEVSGRPVFVFTGTVPMYRTVRRGSTGDDVHQLRLAMRRLMPSRNLSSTGPFNDSLIGAVKAWYVKKGYLATGPSTEQRNQLRQLQQAVQAAKSGSGSSAAGDSEAGGTAEAGAGGGQALADAKADLAAFRKTYGVSVASGEILFVPKLPTRVDTVTVKAGAAAGGPIGTVADPVLVINGDVGDDDADLLRKGMAATLSSDSGGSFGATLTGVGVGVAPVTTKKDDAQADDSDTDSAATGEADGTPIRLKPKNPKKLAQYAGQAFKITIKVGSTGKAVLAVPVAAVFTSADGNARLTVQVASGQTRDVPIKTGLSTDGYVQVTAEKGGQVQAGDRVVVGTG